MKTCNRCLKEKSKTDFFKDKQTSDGLYSICKACKKEATYEWRAKNKDKYNAGAKKWRDNNKDKEYGHEAKRRYGVSLEEYNNMLKAQDFKCAICGKVHNDKVKRGRLYIDHDHQTNKVRKLLCSGCNSMLGYAKDSIETLEKAIAYLKDNK